MSDTVPSSMILVCACGVSAEVGSFAGPQYLDRLIEMFWEEHQGPGHGDLTS